MFRELFDDFLLEARERLDRVEELLLALAALPSAQRGESLETCRRQLHTVKGNSGMMGFEELRSLAHDLEDRIDALDVEAPEVSHVLEGIDAFRRSLALKVAETVGEEAVEEGAFLEGASQELAFGGVRVPFDRLDGLVEQLAEVLQYRNRLVDSVRRLTLEVRPRSQEEAEAWGQLTEAHEALDKNLEFLQERIIQLRMVPLQTLFRHLNRIVHDESAREGKSVKLETKGGSTPLDKALLEVASEALGHLVRNAVNHGIEIPGIRRSTGKPALGTIALTARVQGQEVHIEVADDGQGIDLEMLREAALREEESSASEEELYRLLFRPGFSTRSGTDLSAGRGIGLGAVAEAVVSYGGRVDVSSSPGTGSRFLLRLPLSVSITQALLIQVDGEDYALPLGTVVKTLRFRREELERFADGRVLRWRERLIPVLDLGRWFDLEAEAREAGFLVVLEALGEAKVIAVDRLLGIQDIVVKGLDPTLGSPAGVGGSTILGDGRVILILDAASLGRTADIPESRP